MDAEDEISDIADTVFQSASRTAARTVPEIEPHRLDHAARESHEQDVYAGQ
ncbi:MULTISPECIES: hypothetical protein [unclassified Streptomyces]|uniref:hypothetical protein n=1 Tax=unclassified Streptomyces TaxID=2593676 RepID=UPI00278C44FF|nr:MULTISPECIES: hypothetical protein [unclassified Streptomyces]